MKNLLLILGPSIMLNYHVSAQSKPNIIVILADDLGYGELGCQGNPQIPTPNIDGIARNGIRFTDGYVTASVSAASHAALITGRYQNRFGYEFNPLSAMNEDPDYGLPEELPTIASVMRNAGYVTGMVGKWHLGGTAKYNPLRRGFDEFFGFLHEGHFFVPPPYDNVTSLFRRPVLPGGGKGRSPDGKIMYHSAVGMYEDPYDADNPIYRGGTPIEEHEYLTDAFTREAIGFIDRNKAHPFFLYLPFNAVHSPLQGADEYMKKFSHIEDMHRRIFAAMLANLDDGVGRVMQKIRDEGLEENTIIFFLSDNGGPTVELTSSNSPLRGGKGSLFEGGIRIPFMVQWKNKLPTGTTFNKPVISLDIFATAVAVAGFADNEGVPDLEGTNLIPFLSGNQKGSPHQVLYWRYGSSAALRFGDWKIVKSGSTDFQLYNLSDDLSETTNLAQQNPEKLAELKALWEKWNKQNIDPIFPAPRKGPAGGFITPLKTISN